MPRVTLKDVSEKTGLSKSTVSMYLSGNPKVWLSQENRALIDSVVRELGYNPNRIASALRNGRSHTIGLVLGSLTDSFTSHVAEASLINAERLGYQLLISPVSAWGHERELRSLRNLLDRQVDGIFYMLEPNFDEETKARLISARIPLMVCGYPGFESYRHVAVDFSAAFRSMLSDLEDRGRKELFYCTFSPNCYEQQFDAVIKEFPITVPERICLNAVLDGKQVELERWIKLRPQVVYFDNCNVARLFLKLVDRTAPGYEPEVITIYSFEKDLPNVSDERIAGVLFSCALEHTWLSIRHLVHLIENGTADSEYPLQVNAKYYTKEDFLQSRERLADTVARGIDFSYPKTTKQEI